MLFLRLTGNSFVFQTYETAEKHENLCHLNYYFYKSILSTETAKLGKNPKPKTASLLQCHPLLLRILNSLNLKEVLRNAKQPLTLDIDEKDRSVTLGPYDAVQTMVSILSACTKEVDFMLSLSNAALSLSLKTVSYALEGSL